MTSIELGKKFQSAALAFISSAKIGDLITAYQKGIHEYLGVERFWYPTEAAMARLKEKYLTEENFSKWEELGHKEKNIKYYSDASNFSSFGVEGFPIDKNSFNYRYRFENYGLTEEDYYLAKPVDGTRIIAYRRVYSSKLKPSKGPIQTCCGSYCKLVGDGSKEWFENWIKDKKSTLEEVHKVIGG